MTGPGSAFRLAALLVLSSAYVLPGRTQPVLDPRFGAEAEFAPQRAGASPHPSGLNPFRRLTRSPSGLLYPDVWQPPVTRAIGDQGWMLSGAVEGGAIGTSGTVNTASFLEYGDWNDALTLHRFWFLYEKPESGAYLEGSGGAAGRDDQYYRFAGGKYGRYEIAGIFNSIPHVFSTNARVLWDGAGTGNLTLPAGLTPASSTAGEIESAFVVTPDSVLALKREKFGLSFKLTPSRPLEIFGRVSTETRDGSRPFGGTFSYPGLGQVMETVEPIDYTTTDLAAGVRFSGPVHQFNVLYSGSLFRNDTPTLTWENPGLSPFSPFTPSAGRYALAPDNDYHNIKTDYARNFDFWRGRLTATTSFSQMQQNEALLPPTISTGVINAAGMDIDLDLWNTVAALSQQSAGAEISHLLGDIRLTLQPSRKTRLTGELRYVDVDNKTDYTALNPLTGQYGYIALDGGLAGIIPTRSAIFDPGLPSSRVRIRNAPYETDEMRAKLGIDYRLSSATKLGLSVRRDEFDYAFRERTTVTDDVVRLELTQRGMPRGSVRVGYEFLQRDGSEYVPNPYETLYSSSLPGFMPGFATGQLPHTLSTMRKFDLADRDSRSLDARFLFVLTDASDLTLNARWEEDDMRAEHGLRDVETASFNAEWSYQIAMNSNLYLYFAHESHERNVSNINDAGPQGSDPAPGGVVYPLENGWSEHVAEDNESVGGGFTRAFERFTLDIQYTYSQADSEFLYDYASPAAYFDLFPASEVGAGFPAQRFEQQVLQASLNWHLREGLGLRVTYRYEKEELDDFHYQGLTEPVVGNAIYLAAFPQNFSASAVGVFLEKSF